MALSLGFNNVQFGICIDTVHVELSISMDQTNRFGCGSSLQSISMSPYLPNSFPLNYYPANYVPSNEYRFQTYYNTFNAYTYDMLNQANTIRRCETISFALSNQNKSPKCQSVNSDGDSADVENKPSKIKNIQRRNLANKQERKRMHKLNEALNRLREVIFPL